jgi:hypothetical protein
VKRHRHLVGGPPCLTKAAYCPFDSGSARQLTKLLRVIAAYAAGGLTALAARKDARASSCLTK